MTNSEDFKPDNNNASYHDIQQPVMSIKGVTNPSAFLFMIYGFFFTFVSGIPYF